MLGGTYLGSLRCGIKGAKGILAAPPPPMTKYFILKGYLTRGRRI